MRWHRQIGEKLEEMDRVLTLYEQGSAQEAQDVIRAGAGRNLMETIRQQILVMYNAERDLLDTRRAESRRTNSFLLAATLVGSAFILLIGALSIYLVQRNAREREQARRALKTVNESLEETIAERTADLREANDEIQRFAYIVSHDLRSPLVNIMGFTTEIETIKKDIFENLAALRQTDSAEARKDIECSREFDESLSFIKSSIGKMDRLINSILKLSREGNRTFNPEYVSMDGLLKTITDNVSHQAAENDVEIILEPLPPIKSDRLALEQIFSNLVDNGLKYTQPGRPGQLRIRGRIHQAQVIYEVEDNGRGIAPEDHQRVFDLFRRAGTAGSEGRRNRSRPCTRAGAPARRLHDAEIGARHRHDLHRDVAAAHAGDREQSSMSEHVRIVMVEDDEGHARLIEKNIRRAGVLNEIVGFENGTKAVEFLFGPDGTGKVNRGNALLIMLDLNLPDMSGVDILKRVKENEHLKRTPVVVLTTTDDEARNQALLRPRRQCLHHQAGELRQLRQRHSTTRPVLLRHPGSANHVSHAKERSLR